MKSLQPVALLLVLAACSGCWTGPSTYDQNPREAIYADGPPAMPLLSKKHEAQAGASVALGLYNLHGAYALTDHVGFIGTTGFYLGNRDSRNYDRRFNSELGAGLFTSLGAGDGRLECYAGYGLGTLSGEAVSTPDYYGPVILDDLGSSASLFERDSTTTGTAHHFFVQASIGSQSPTIGVAIGVKASWVHIQDLMVRESDLYKSFDTLTQTFPEFRSEQTTVSSPSSIVIETSALFRFGSPSFWVFFELWQTNALTPSFSDKLQRYNLAGGFSLVF